MREILFRGKRIDNGEWVVITCKWCIGGQEIVAIAPSDNAFYPHCEMSEWYEVDPTTIGQYTGLSDKNGKKIFEGDICRFREWDKGETCWVGKVYWEHQQFMITGGPNKECETMFELRMSRFIPEDIQVIGNIHDDPKLLEVANG